MYSVSNKGRRCSGDQGPSAQRSIESLGTSNDRLQGIVAAAFGWSRTPSGGNSATLGKT